MSADPRRVTAASPADTAAAHNKVVASYRVTAALSNYYLEFKRCVATTVPGSYAEGMAHGSGQSE